MGAGGDGVGAGGEERRAAPRVPLALRVRLGRVGEPGQVLQALDLSCEGIFVLTQEPLPVGREVALRVELPGADSIPVQAVVVRTQVVPALLGPALSGMGLRFRDLGERERGRLRAVVQAVRDALAAP